MAKDLIYNEKKDKFYCPYCEQEVEKLIVEYEGWGYQWLDEHGAVEEKSVEKVTLQECPHCGMQVFYNV